MSRFSTFAATSPSRVSPELTIIAETDNRETRETPARLNLPFLLLVLLLCLGPPRDLIFRAAPCILCLTCGCTLHVRSFRSIDNQGRLNHRLVCRLSLTVYKILSVALVRLASVTSSSRAMNVRISGRSVLSPGLLPKGKGKSDQLKRRRYGLLL